MLLTILQRKAAEKAERAPRKAKKDPKAPKRALSAYMFFSQDWRERIKEENPDASFGECFSLGFDLIVSMFRRRGRKTPWCQMEGTGRR